LEAEWATKPVRSHKLASCGVVVFVGAAVGVVRGISSVGVVSGINVVAGAVGGVIIGEVLVDDVVGVIGGCEGRRAQQRSV
jgi:hypothetical protein